MGDPQNFYLSDLQQPSLQDVFEIPKLEKPKSSFSLGDHGDKQATASEITLSAVIELLRDSDTTKLRPQRTTSPDWHLLTPLQAQLAAAAPDLLSTDAAGPTPVGNAAGRCRTLQAPITRTGVRLPLSIMSPEEMGGEASGTPRAKRPRTATKLNMTGKAAVVKTPAEEAARLAVEFETCVRSLLQRLSHAQDAPVGEGEDDEEGDMAVDADGSDTKLLAHVRQVGEAVLRLNSNAAAMELVPVETLSSMLRLLLPIIIAGSDKLINEEDEREGGQAASAMVALEAATTALRVMTAYGAPQQVFIEDVIEAAVTAIRFHMQYNVLPFHDARLRALSRPELCAATGDSGDLEAAATPAPSKGKPGARGGRQKRGAGGSRAKAALATEKLTQPTLSSILDRVQALLALLSDLIPIVAVQPAMLQPLLRSCTTSITVADLPLLQTNAIALLASAFGRHPDLRRAVLTDIFSLAVPYLGNTRAPRRYFAASEGTPPGRIQMLTAAVLLMTQSCVDLPAVNTEVRLLTQCFAPAAAAADHFWTLCLESLPVARAQKSDNDTDIRVVLDGIVRDLLAVMYLPQWPGAGALLLRLVNLLNSQLGLQHSDASVRQTCVDVLGRLLTALKIDEAEARCDEYWLQDVTATYEFSDMHAAAQELLLKHLADQAHAASPAAACGCRFWLARSFAEAATEAGKRDAGEDEMRQLVVAALRQREELSTLVFDVGLTAADACRLARWLVQGSIGRARQALLSWLLELLDPRRQSPTMRAKAVKALGDLVAADASVLGVPAVRASVERMLQDEAISVREAALALIGRHMAGDVQLTLSLFDVVIKAAEDPGPSVRRCAIKILRDCCITVPGFTRGVDAARTVLMHACDSEESVQSMVAKVFASLWFSDSVPAADRAQQLAEVAMSCYDAGGPSIHLPLGLQHPLVAVLKCSMGCSTGANARAEQVAANKAARELSHALLEAVLAAQERCGGGDASHSAALPPLLALHALVVADVAVGMPEKDPSRFARSLAPYLKLGQGAGPGPGSDARERRSAEALLCVLSVVDSVLSAAGYVGDATVLTELSVDLMQLVNHHRFTPVMAAACKCLGTMAARHPAAATRLTQMANVYWSWLRQPATQNPAHLPRFLFIMGQLCRYGAAVIEGAGQDASTVGGVISMSGCVDLFMQYWQYKSNAPGQAQVRRCALEALGLLTIAQPAVMVEPNSAAKQIMKSALQAASPAAYKVTALGNLADLLQADAEDLQLRQRSASLAQSGSAPATTLKSVSARKQRGRKGRGSEKADDKPDDLPAVAAAVATHNGEGDNLSQSSAILQEHWDAVLQLATDTSAAAAGGGTNDASGDDGAPVRRRALDLIEIVMRDGLVGPWTAVPALVALCTEPAQDVRARALRLLGQLAEKHPRYVDADKLISGVADAYSFHRGLSQSPSGYAVPSCGAPPAALAGIAALYSDLIWAHKALRSDFLRGLLRFFKPAVGLQSSAALEAGARRLGFVAAVVAALPLRRGDEACMLVQEVDSVVSTRGEDVLHELKAMAKGTEAAGSDKQRLVCLGATALSIMLLLKRCLVATYAVNAERVAGFTSASERRKQEERVALVRDGSVTLQLDVVEMGAPNERRTSALYASFKSLLEQDATAVPTSP